MKTRIQVLIATLVFSWALLADAHDVKVVLYPTIGPVSVPGLVVSPSFSAFAANVLLALESGRADVGGSIRWTPVAANRIGRAISNSSNKVTVSAFDMYATQGTSWRGLPAHGAFVNEHGTHYRTAVAIRSYSAFTLAEVNLTKKYSDYPDLITFALGGPKDESPYQNFDSERLIGVSWGPDHRPGGGDDIRYDSHNPGSYSTPINELFFVGFGDLDVAAPTKPNTDAQQFAAYLDYLKVNSPYSVYYTYTVRGVSSTVKMNVDLTPRGSHPPFPHRPHRPFWPFRDR